MCVYGKVRHGRAARSSGAGSQRPVYRLHPAWLGEAAAGAAAHAAGAQWARWRRRLTRCQPQHEEGAPGEVVVPLDDCKRGQEPSAAATQRIIGAGRSRWSRAQPVHGRQAGRQPQAAAGC